MDIQSSRDFIVNRTDWMIDEDTFQVIDEQRCMWIARVTTTHHHKQGNPEHSFIILVRLTEHFVINNENLPVLAEWFLRQKGQR